MLYENRDAAPPAYLVPEGIFVSSGYDALVQMRSGEFAAWKRVLLERTERTTLNNLQKPGNENSIAGNTAAHINIEADPDSSSGLSERYRQVKSFAWLNTNAVKITCQPQAASWLVLTNIYYPGWQAYVDGKKTAIARANFVFQAVKIERGYHEILFAYEPYSFYAGCGIFAAFVLFYALALTTGVYKRVF